MAIEAGPTSVVQPRGGAGMVAVGGALYVIGGFDGNELGDVFQFNIATKSWSHLNSASIPPRR